MTEQEKTPEYGRLRNFWQAKTDTNGTTVPDSKSPVTPKVNGSQSLKRRESNSSSETQVSTHNPGPGGEAGDSTMADLAPSALEFDQEIVGVNLAEFLQRAQQIGGEVAEHAALVKKAFNAQLSFLTTATRCVKPNDAEFTKLLSDTANAISEIQQYREARRSSPVFNHLSAVSESIPALAWVTIAPTPGPYVKEMNDAGQFYSNRVLKDFKEKPGHTEWTKAWVGTLTALQAYIRKNHTTGLVWGKQPYAGGATSSGPSGPPPPPPPPAFDLAAGLDNLGVSDDRAALFSALNKGEEVTSGLRKVTADMQTHKNPNLRTGGAVPATIKGSTSSVQEPKAAPVTKPPVLAFDGKKWLVEYQIGKRDLKIEDVEMNQVVYVFGCKDSTLTIKGKLNSIVVDSCVKTAIVFDSLVSSIEFVNTRDCQMQVMGTVPTITIDKADGLQMFLSKDSLQVEIVSAKSSALNVMVPQASGDFAEHPIPEQFKTVIGAKGLVTTATETVGV